MVLDRDAAHVDDTPVIMGNGFNWVRDQGFDAMDVEVHWVSPGWVVDITVLWAGGSREKVSAGQVVGAVGREVDEGM